jgi:hypothetical protein
MRVIVIALVLGLAAAACGGEDSDDTQGASPRDFNQPFTDAQVYPVIASSEVVVGSNRFLVGLLDEDDAPTGSPDIDLHIDFYNLEESSTEPVSSTDMQWVWIDKPERGLYEGTVTFDSPGKWGGEFTVTGSGLDESVKAGFDVAEEATTPAIGERVPSSDTPTIEDVDGLKEISTDDHPDARYYQSSIADAVAAKEPFVVTFATPKFCASQVCGPTWDTVKEVAQDEPTLTFIHVEPYDLKKTPELVPVESVIEWGLRSEPWVFVVDAGGRLVAKYEGVVTALELEEELKSL